LARRAARRRCRRGACRRRGRAARGAAPRRARGAGRGRPLARKARRARSGPRSARRGAPVPRAAAGPADARALSVGAAGRRPRPLPAAPPAPRRRARARAGRGAEAAAEGDPRPRPVALGRGAARTAGCEEDGPARSRGLARRCRRAACARAAAGAVGARTRAGRRPGRRAGRALRRDRRARRPRGGPCVRRSARSRRGLLVAGVRTRCRRARVPTRRRPAHCGARVADARRRDRRAPPDGDLRRRAGRHRRRPDPAGADRRPLRRGRARLGGARARRLARPLDREPATPGRRGFRRPSGRTGRQPPAGGRVAARDRPLRALANGRPRRDAERARRRASCSDRLRAPRPEAGRPGASRIANAFHLVADACGDGCVTLGPGATFAAYRIEAEIGRGGMGVVYRATDTRLDRPVALKLIAPELAEDPSFRERFLRESRLAAAIDHGNVLPIYEAGEHEGQLFLAMRFVQGTDLKALLRERKTLAPEEALSILAPIADALDAAHAKGLVHRDVKPANILLDERGHPYLSDFGLTKEAGGTSTQTGHVVGTLDYLAPE